MDLSGLFELLATPWALFVAVFFFCASIFVHELGHYIAARRRGLKVERFSIGFGPRLFTWKRDGVEWCLSAIPLGGYVALPQLADLSGIEGEYEDGKEKLPPISYADTMIVAVMGAVFNVIFAFVLATVLWGLGMRTVDSLQTTRIGWVLETIEDRDGEEVAGPAHVAGLRAGDRILRIDDQRIDDWRDVQQALVIGGGRHEDGRPRAEFLVERAGDEVALTVYPVLADPEGIRKVGIVNADSMVIGSIYPDSPVEQAGLQEGDRIVALDGNPFFSRFSVAEYVSERAGEPIVLTYERDGRQAKVTVEPEPVVFVEGAEPVPHLGFLIDREVFTVHIDPLTQVTRSLEMTFQVLSSLLNPQSDIGLSKLSGPVGIGYAIKKAAEVDFGFLLWLIVLINVNLAVINLLPIPVLDGGHMTIATIEKLRGKPLPATWIIGARNLVALMLIGVMLYVAVFDVLRVKRDVSDESAYREQERRAVTPVFGRDAADPGDAATETQAP